MKNKEAIDNFLQKKRIAIVGVSRAGKKFGNIAYRELKAKGYKIFPINNKTDRIEDDICYPSLRDLPEPVDGVLIVVPKNQTKQIIQEAYTEGIKNIWIQQGAESKEAIDLCKNEKINCVYGQCILMFAEPVGLPHNIHRCIWRLIGKYPK
jgi:hypothetical protein